MVLGYDLRNGVTAEIVAVLSIGSDPQTTDIKTEIISIVASVINTTKKSLMNSFFLTEGTNIFVFGGSTMRQYTTTKVDEYTRTSGTTVASNLTIENYLAFKSIDAMQTVYTFA